MNVDIQLSPQEAIKLADDLREAGNAISPTEPARWVDVKSIRIYILSDSIIAANAADNEVSGQ